MSNFNIKNWYWSIPGDASHVWSSASNCLVAVNNSFYQAWLSAGNSPTAIESVRAAMSAVILGTDLLVDSDVTMTRIMEAVVLGLNTWTASDVVAWVNYRRALRNIINGTDTTSTSIPTKPAYPAGT